MKFLPSSITTTTTTSSSSTADSSSFDGSNVSSSKSATAGCIAGVFRRLLCLNSLPTYPSDDHFIRETELENTCSSSSVDFHMKAEVKNFEGASTPNIVARLMGLESLPQIDLLDGQKGSGCSAAIARSRSMNYVDTVLKELEHSTQGKKKHRRVMSFRETPTFLDLEDENFLILSFENGAERMQLATKGSYKLAAEKIKNKNRREQSSDGQSGKNNGTRNGSNEEELEKLMTGYPTKSFGTHIDHNDFSMLKDSSNNILRSNKCHRNSLANTSDKAKFSQPTIHKQERERSLSRKRMKKIEDECLPVKKLETESTDESENSSPNSVLDNIIDFPCDPEDTTISVGVSRLRNSKTRRTLTEELENYRKLNLVNAQNTGSKSKTAAGKYIQLKRSTGKDQRYAEINRMAEKETMESSWVRIRSSSSKIKKLVGDYDEDDEEIISTELELKILDQLVTEFVVDLQHHHLHPCKFS